MATVPLWSGVEVRALREARRMGLREFADHLGISDRTVSTWEKAGESLHPRPHNQAVLDTSLATASTDVRNRFVHITTGHQTPQPQRRPTPAPTVVPDGAVHYLRHPLDHKLMTLVEPGPFRARPGRRPIWVPAFYIDIHPTTNAEYARFLAATGHHPPTQWPAGIYAVADDPDALHDDPVTGLSWDDACAYAFWAGKDLATTLQWDRAARGAEGMLPADLWEWVRVDTGPARRGPSRHNPGGFRCAAPVARTLDLLAA